MAGPQIWIRFGEMPLVDCDRRRLPGPRGGYRGKCVCGFGYAAAFSFYPGKNLGAHGEGGSLTTNDDAVAQFAREMRTHGESKRYFHDRIGYNYRMDGFQGAVLNVKLKYLDRWTARRQELARLYRERLEGSDVRIPQDGARCESAYLLFTVWVQNRDTVREELARKGVQTAVHYPVPVHRFISRKPIRIWDTRQASFRTPKKPARK